MIKDELIEQLADQVHASWSHWMEYLFSKCVFSEDSTAFIPASCVERWQRQLLTPYQKLSEAEKQSDRERVVPLLPIIEAWCQTAPTETYIDEASGVWVEIERDSSKPRRITASIPPDATSAPGEAEIIVTRLLALAHLLPTGVITATEDICCILSCGIRTDGKTFVATNTTHGEQVVPICSRHYSFLANDTIEQRTPVRLLTIALQDALVQERTQCSSST